MSTQWTPWTINEGQSSKDQRRWHVYRAKRVNGKWSEYQQRTYPRSIFPGSQQVLAYLHEQEAEANAPPSTTPSKQGTEQDGGEDEDKKDNTQVPAQGIAPQMQIPRIEQPAYPGHPAHINNPYANPQTPGNSPFQTPQNYPRGYSYALPSRSMTPAPGQSPYNRYPGHPQYPGAYGPTGLPATSGYPLMPQQTAGGYGHQLPAMGYGYAGQAGAAIQNPRNINRSMTAAPGSSRSSSSRQHSDQSQAPVNIKDFKVQKPKDYRKFFKTGRVFKAFWKEAASQIPGVNNPFGEILRFVILRPHKRHSICLAIHTYRNLGTTAPFTRARDHVVIYSGEQEPPLVPGEDEIIRRRPAIKVTLDAKGEPLLPASRLGLSKLYTIEHHVPVFPVGKLHSRDVDRIKQYYIEVQGIFSSGPSQLPDVNEDEEEEDEDEEDG